MSMSAMAEQIPPPSPPCTLVSSTEQMDEITECSLVFYFQALDGRIHYVSWTDVLDALQFAAREGAVVPFPIEWWAKMGRYDGHADEAETGKTVLGFKDPVQRLI